MKRFLTTFIPGLVLFMAAPNLEANTYANWKTQVFSAAEQANPAISGESADIMRDGIPNLMKYALGLDPHAYSNSSLPRAYPDSNGFLSMSFTEDSSLTDIYYAVEYSTDCVTWNRGGAYLTQIGNVPQQGTQSLVTYETHVPNTAFHRGFMRLTILEGEAMTPSWQIQNFGNTGVDPDADPDGDGFSNFTEFVNGTNPNDYYNGTAPTLTIVGGGNQVGAPSTLLATPLSISSYFGANNAPVTLSVTSGTAQLAATPTGTPSSSISLRTTSTNMGNVAQVYLKTGASVSDLSTITITAPGYPSSAITTTVGCYDPSIAPAAPSNGTVTPGPTAGEIDLTWVNNADNATYIVIQDSTDGTNWTTAATLTDPTATSYAVTGLTQGTASITSASRLEINHERVLPFQKEIGHYRGHGAFSGTGPFRGGWRRLLLYFSGITLQSRQRARSPLRCHRFANQRNAALSEQ
jgi:hypothetical protein